MKAETPVDREELERIAREYHRLREEHHRARPASRTRRHLEATLDRLAARFEQRLHQAGASEVEQRRWHDRLWHATTEPTLPPPTPPLLFLGRSAAGSELQLLGRPDGLLDAVMDGKPVARIEAADELARTSPGLDFELDGVVFAERFRTRAEDRANLRSSIESERRPPSELIPKLLADGLLDRDLGLTVRGRRALRLDAEPARHALPLDADLAIRTRGRIGESGREALASALEAAGRLAPRAPLHLRGSLVHDEDPAVERPFVAKASVDMGTRVVRAHVAAATEAEAVDLVSAHLAGRLRELASHDDATRQEGAPPEPGEWRHRDLPSNRPPLYDRPPDGRRIVRRKTYASEPMTPEEAVWEMRLLAHDFHLFTDLSSGEEAVVYAGPDGTVRLKRSGGNGAYVDPVTIDPDPPATLTTEEAIERLDTGAEPFVFFLDRSSGRGALLYRRYDGHYGLVEARREAQ